MDIDGLNSLTLKLLFLIEVLIETTTLELVGADLHDLPGELVDGNLVVLNNAVDAQLLNTVTDLLEGVGTPDETVYMYVSLQLQLMTMGRENSPAAIALTCSASSPMLVSSSQVFTSRVTMDLATAKY